LSCCDGAYMSDELVCRWDNRPCDMDIPCITWHPSGDSCIVCMRYKGVIDENDLVLGNIKTVS